MPNPDEDSLQNQTPALYAAPYAVDGNISRQLVNPETVVRLEENGEGRYIVSAYGRFPLLAPEDTFEGDGVFYRATFSGNGDDFALGEGNWENNPAQSTPTDVLESLKGQFSYKLETDTEKGLRLPQIGALHAVSANWTTSTREPVTVVMPTGTGKTETMVAIFAAHRIERLLVVVPSDALRTQIAQKFESYGVLQDFGVIGSDAIKPVVGRVEHGFDSELGATGFASACNVIIATTSALNQSTPEIKAQFLAQFSHLFVDEAHHIAATTWKEVRDSFIGKPVVQFTATPFREDGQRLGGKMIYTFSLKDAQALGVFSNINYISVVDFNDTDRAVAKTAIEKLNEDLGNGLDHLMMARVRTKKKANELAVLYEELAPEHKPIVLYSGLKARLKNQRLEQLRSHESKIVICVDMLGEGFDLPSLKVAAIHEPHKSLGVTLQFIGRFARVGGTSLGDATAVVPRGERSNDSRLRELYAEDSDWNKVIRNLSADAIEEQQEMSDFERAFSNLPEDVSIVNLAPKMSAVVYKTQTTSWHPERIEGVYKSRLLNPPAINYAEHVAWFVTKDVETVRWGDIKSLAQTSYNLFVAYWDSTNNLLYINASNNEGVFKDLAEALCGESVELYRGKDVYKTMASLNRRIATNVGLLDTRNQDSKFELRVGGNVIGALDEEARRNKTQTNIFAHGIDNQSGEKLSVGASLKGRVWSYKTSVSLKQWIGWADSIGSKLKDDSIDPAEVMDGFIIPESLQTRPAYVALALEWPTEAYLDVSESTEIKIGQSSAPFVDAELTVTEFNDNGPIPFTISLPDGSSAKYKIVLNNGKMIFSPVEGQALVKKTRSTEPLADALNKIGLRIILEKEAIIEPSMVLVVPRAAAPAYRRELLKTIDWTGINIRNESQGRSRDQATVQAKAIEYVGGLASWDLVIDDDGAGEIADIVAMRIDGNKIHVNLVHCKFSHEDNPGARVIDLYEVCGQAQKSILRRRDPQLMIDRLISREKKRRRNGYSGLIVGDDAMLQSVAEKIRLLEPRFVITIVQPGVSKAQVSAQQLELIAATERYIKDSGGGTQLEVMVSD
jgi:superfamily II DNA or RNA helicase